MKTSGIFLYHPDDDVVHEEITTFGSPYVVLSSRLCFGETSYDLPGLFVSSTQRWKVHNFSERKC